MTKALEAAFKRASKLSESEQDALAAAIQAEIDADGEWGKLLSKSEEPLGKLADEAIDEYRAGRTRKARTM